jgi:hypothetical protein
MALDSWWEIDGFALTRGIPPLEELPLGRFCSFIRWWATENADETSRAKFEARLWKPAPGEKPRGPWSPEAENEALRSLKAMLG